MAHRTSKRVKQGQSLIDTTKAYTLEQAVNELEKFPKTKFDESVELHFHLGVDVKNNEQAVRGTVVLPHGLGKTVRVACFCRGEYEAKARAANADHVGAEDLINKVAGGFMDFDVVVATPDMMRDLSKLGKVLGPRGLMPTPKAGTVTVDVEKAIREAKAGKVEFKVDKQAGIHIAVGKRSFSKDKIVANAKQLIDAVVAAKPNSVKNIYVKSLSLSSSMGPGLKVTV